MKCQHISLTFLLIIALHLLALIGYNVTHAATIEGVVFNDFNNNGVQEACEPGLENMTVYIQDHTKQSAGQGGFYNTTVDSDGRYSSSPHDPGNFTIWSDQPNVSWHQTAPEQSEDAVVQHTFTITNNNDTITKNFGFRDPNAAIQQCSFSCDSVTEISTAQCQALVSLYDSTDGENWLKNSGWKQTNTPCTWEGIICNGAGNVTNISLYNNQLSGTVPDLSALTELLYFNLSGNQLTGTLPDLSAFTQLQVLAVGSNQLSGAIPDLSALSQMKLLHLYDNQFTGTIPAEINGLTNLEELRLETNQLSGNIPDLSALTQLTKLRLFKNQLSGPIPDLSNATNLQELNLQENELSGEMPNWFNTLTDLEGLFLGDNQLTGNIPDLSALTNLTYLYLHTNQLTGDLPDFSSLTKVQQIYLSYNQLTGTLPDLSKLTHLQILSLENNQLTGALPDFGSLSNLEKLYLQNNQFTGAIADFSALTNLSKLGLTGNQLCQDTNVNYGDWTEVDEFPVCGNPNLILISPAHGATEIPISGHVFTWEPDTRASAHRIVISKREDFADFTEASARSSCNDTTSCITEAIPIIQGTQRYTASDLAKNTTYYWRVRSGFDPLNWSEVRSFTTGAAPKTGCNGNIQLAGNLCEGLTAYYPMTGNVNDASSNGNDGIVNGATLTTDRHGNANSAYEFDGKTHRIKLAHTALNQLDTFSLGFWIKTTKTVINQHMVSLANSENANEFLIRHDAGKFVIIMKEAQHAFDMPKINDGQWHLVNIVRSSSKIEILVDGSLAATWQSAPIGSLKVDSSGFWLGGDQDCVGGCWVESQQFGGIMDDILIHNRALSASEIQSYYDSTKPTTQVISDEMMLENAEDGNVQGWSIYDNIKGEAAFANVFDSDKNSRVIELTGNSLSGYELSFDNSTNFIARWSMKTVVGDITETARYSDGYTIYWRVKTSGAVIYLSYRSDVPLGCHFTDNSTYVTCGLNASMRDKTWHTITRDLEADLKSIAPNLELQEVEHLKIRMAGRIDDIQLLNRNEINFHTISGTITNNGRGVGDKSLSSTGADCQPSDNQGHLTCTVPEGWFGTLIPENTNEHYFVPFRTYSKVSENITGQDFTTKLIEEGLEDAEDGDTQGWSIYNDTKGDAAFANVVERETNNRVIELTGHSSSGYLFAFPSPFSTTRFIAQWRMKMTSTDWQPIYWRIKTSGEVVYLQYGANHPKGCELAGTYIICGLGENMPANTWYTITRDLKADLKALKPDLELLEVEYLQIRMAGQIDDIKLLQEIPVAGSCNAITEIPQSECEALITFYDSLGGENWTNKTGWLQTNNPCNGWYNVACKNGHVSHIHLEENNLVGTIPDLSALTELEALAIGRNAGITGAFPDISQLSKLFHFSVGATNLSGSLPANMVNASQLRELGVGETKLSGDLPDFSQLSNLQVLDLNHCQLSGEIPALPSSLTLLNLAGNNLSGPIPALSGLSNLQTLWLSENQLTGSIPELTNLTQLQQAYFSHNQLTGSMPSLAGLTELIGFSISRNQLTGPIPELSQLTKLEKMWLDNNDLSGPIPDVSMLTNLQLFTLDGNTKLAGPIPSLPANVETLTLGGELCQNPYANYHGHTATMGSFPTCETVVKLVTKTETSPICLNQPFELVIEKQYAQPVDGFELVLNFDTNALKINQITVNNPLATLQKEVNNNDGQVRLAMGTFGESPLGDSVALATVNLTPLATSADTCLTFNTTETLVQLEQQTLPYETTAMPLIITACEEQTLPTAAFTMTTSPGDLQVQLDASGSTAKGNITHYQWTSSDGQTATGASPTLLFSQAGTYTVTLTVTDEQGMVSEPVEQSVMVSDISAPLAVYTLKLAKRGTGNGEIQSTVPNTQFYCGTDCNRTNSDYSGGTLVTLKATPAPNSTFAKWGGGCRGDGVLATVTMDKVRSCSVYFDLDVNAPGVETLTINQTGNGGGKITVKQDRSLLKTCDTPECTSPHLPGSEVTLIAKPQAGSIFIGWQGSCTGTETTTTVTLTEASTCEAQFALLSPPDGMHRLTVNKIGSLDSGGEVKSTNRTGIECGEDCEDNYKHNQFVELIAIATPQSRFIKWSGDCGEEDLEGKNTTRIKMTADKTCTAIFEDNSAIFADMIAEQIQTFAETSDGRLMSEVYPPDLYNNDERLREATLLTKKVIEIIGDMMVLTGSWPEQFHEIEWLDPFPVDQVLYTQSIKVISEGTEIDLDSGKVSVAGNYIKVEVELYNKDGELELVPILIYEGNVPTAEDNARRRHRPRFVRIRFWRCYRYWFR